MQARLQVPGSPCQPGGGMERHAMRLQSAAPSVLSHAWLGTGDPYLATTVGQVLQCKSPWLAVKKNMAPSGSRLLFSSSPMPGPLCPSLPVPGWLPCFETLPHLQPRRKGEEPGHYGSCDPNTPLAGNDKLLLRCLRASRLPGRALTWSYEASPISRTVRPETAGL
ncbi:uncharacterized protein BO80DRAFT_246779 [Aspergillus ibericus CBS 121593]|uniref:Uncharacterized protein n=1 Tax=Aspergillus ibericus CBS 121593 TaxID=1448316 RepID=A0A395GKC5_9EURO|nr:hypothetical protein BO80DRAFT_246779 [Aspergillus ibericus CBS 121593]RAK95941.1 hypothetical protein BO80DRAFT_246779 [Aspergillus ibericus CBS 121593]